MTEQNTAYASIDEVKELLAGQRYICDRNIATVVFLACKLGKPLLVEGPAGVGKTELAKVIAGSLGSRLIRLQCYEGLDESKALYEWEYAKQLLYTQILKDKIGEVTAGTSSLSEAVDRLTAQDDVFFSKRFILQRPLLQAIQSEDQVVLLLDEIDKADSEFEAFLLEVLSDFQVTIPEIGTVEAIRIPIVVLTSNNAREMSDALKRRCMHLYIDFPNEDLELEIVHLKVPEVGEELSKQLVQIVQAIRELDLKKAPSISETLDWARAMVVMNVDSLEDDVVKDTLSTICKYEGDLRKAEKELAAYLGRKRAEREAAERPQVQPPTGDKDLLH